MSKDSQQSEEVDLGQLFKMIGNMFDKLFKFTGNIFNKLFLAFVWLVFFVKKHFIKLVIAGIAGIVSGFVLQKSVEPTYKSYLLVKQNYETGESLYNSISYYNDLIQQKDTLTLAIVLNLEPASVASISEFEIGSVIDDNDRLKNYNNYIKGLDSVLASTFEYETYLKNEKEYNHKFQQITIKAKERSNFKTLFNRIVESINTNDYFVREQQKDTLELFNRKLALERALIKSDSLQNTYKHVLEMLAQQQSSSQTSVTIKNTEDVSKTKEFELYQNDLEIQREIVEIEREIEDKKRIVEIVSSKQDSGSIDDKKQVLGIKIGYKLYYGLFFSVLTFIVLLGLSFVKFLEKFKEKV